jgi:anti-sigma-K factor RskA
MTGCSRVKLGAVLMASVLLALSAGEGRAQGERRMSDRPPEYIGVLKLDDDKSGANVHVEGKNTLVFKPLVAFRLPDGLVFEFWLTPTRGPDFVLLGRSRSLRPLRFKANGVAELGNGDRIMVVAEKPRGAASGNMEGPFVMVGELESRP